MLRNALLIVAFGSALASSIVLAQQPKPFEASDTEEVTATIAAISQSDRNLTLLAEDGTRMVVEAGPEITNFDKVKPGDEVVVTYYQGLIADVKPKGEGVPGAKITTSKATSPPGGMPAKAVGTTVATTVVIESVDKAEHTVTFKRADGQTRTLAVESPDGKEFIEKLKPGDEVQVTYREAVAVAIEPNRG